MTVAIATTPDLSAPAKVVRGDEGFVLDVFGDRIRMILTVEDTGGLYSLAEMETPMGGGPPLHVHRAEDEIFMIESGRYEFTIDGKAVPAGPGDVVWGPRDQPHTFRAVSEGCRMKVMFSPGGFERFFAANLPEFQKEGPPDFARLAEIGLEYWIEYL